MIDFRDKLKAYINNFPGHFVGFFNFTSIILAEIGNDWFLYGTINKDQLAKEWANTFFRSSESLKEISKNLSKINDEFILSQENPTIIMENFKDKIKHIVK